MTDPNKKEENVGQTPPAENPATPAPQTSALQQQLDTDYANAINATEKVYDDEIDSVDALIKASSAKKQSLLEQDKNYQKRENAYRYISGLGDTLSGIANLVGTANGASNQNQTYNSHAIVQKAEQARKERKLEMDQLDTRLDEMKARARELRSAKDLKTAELNAQQAREQRELTLKEQQYAREDAARAWTQSRQEKQDAQTQENWQKTFDEGVRQFDAEQQRLKEQNTEKLDAEKELADAKLQAELAKQAAKNASDPEYQKKVLETNISTIRDELAQNMGYENYNDYLRYKNVGGWGADIDGQRNKNSKKIRKERSSANPETEQLLNNLQNPSMLSEDQVRMIISASPTLADVVSSGEPIVSSNGKKKVW